MSLLVALAMLPGVRAETSAPKEPLSLWYRQPARQWVGALSVGNGRLGAMVFGGVASKRIQFNEDTVWNGEPHEYQHPGGLEIPRHLARAAVSNKQAEAEKIASRHRARRNGLPAEPESGFGNGDGGIRSPRRDLSS